MAPNKLALLLTLTLLPPTITGCGEEKKADSEETDDDESKKKKKKKKKKKDEEDEKKGDAPKLTAVYGDDKTPMFAYVVSSGTSEMVLQLSSEELKCDDVRPSGFSIGDKKMVSVILAHKLQPDGKREWVMVRATGYNFDEKKQLRNDRKDEPKLEVTSADPEKGFEGSLSVTLKHKEADKSLVLDGDVVAKGCGVKKRTSAKDPAPNPQKNIVLTIAGEKVTVTGAKITYEDDRKTIDLTSAPQDCSFRSAGDFGLSLAVKDSGGMHAYLRGDAIQGNLNKSGELGVDVKLGPKKDGKQEVEMKGSFTMFDYEVKYEGKVDAVVCEKKKK